MYVRKSFCRSPNFSDFPRSRFLPNHVSYGEIGLDLPAYNPYLFNDLVFNELIKHEEEVCKRFLRNKLS